jgi:hypothetical protein
MRKFAGFAMSLLVAGPALAADAIPYPDSSQYNTATYSFSASSDADVIAYFVSKGIAGYDNQLGLLVNGVLSPAGFGLDNQTSAVGDSFNFGPVHSGDALTFVMKNLTIGRLVYSDPSLNGSYDDPGVTAHNHVYSTTYTQTSPIFNGVPKGVYVGFEDNVYPFGDYNYNDESFVFTNVRIVPEPGSLALLTGGLLAIGLVTRRARTRSGSPFLQNGARCRADTPLVS